MLKYKTLSEENNMYGRGIYSMHYVVQMLIDNSMQNAQSRLWSVFKQNKVPGPDAKPFQ